MVDIVKMMTHRKGDGCTHRPIAGTTCLISGPNCDNDEGYTYEEVEVLWTDEIFVIYRKRGCWPVVNKWEHIRSKPLHLGMTANMTGSAMRASHGQAPAQAEPAAVDHDEDLLEKLYWEFDSQRKKTGEEGLAFKVKMRSYASEFRRRSDGKMTFAQSVSDDMMNLADRLGSEYDDVDPRAWKHLLVYAPKAAPAAVAGPSEAVAYLDIGAGGYLDLGTDLTDEALSRLPKGRHALVIAGTYGIYGYTAAPTTQPAPQQEAASVDLKTMELAESVGLIGPASRTHDLHAAIQRFHDLICANATIKAAQMAAEAISGAAPQPSPQADSQPALPEITADCHPNLIAAELRRLHAENGRLASRLKAYEDLGGAADDVQLLRMGYAAARLEIQSLQARIKTTAEERADELMVAHLDGGMRAEQPAPQPTKPQAGAVPEVRNQHEALIRQLVASLEAKK